MGRQIRRDVGPGAGDRPATRPRAAAAGFGRGYVAVETAVNLVINTALGMVVFTLLFRGRDQVALWGPRGLVADCVVQGFMVGLMSVLPPCILTRIRIARTRPGTEVEPVGAMLRRALIWAIAGLTVLTGLAALIAWLSGASSIGFSLGLTLKALASVTLVSLISPLALGAMLKRTRWPSPAGAE